MRDLVTLVLSADWHNRSMTISPTVSVRGQATIMAEPELATLTISIEAQGATARRPWSC